MAAPRCRADHYTPDGTRLSCRYACAPSSPYCGPNGRGHTEVGEDRTARRWARPVGHHGWQVRRPRDPNANGQGWMWVAVVLALADAGEWGAVACHYCGGEMDGPVEEWEVRRDATWCGLCAWTSLARKRR